MKKKLLNIMMGTHNPDFKRGLDSVFNCVHLDWTKQYKPSVSGHVSPNTKHLQSEILHKFNEFKPDVVFLHLQCGDAILDDTMIKMRKNGTVVFSWTGDVRHPIPPFYIQQGRHISSTLFTNMNDVITCRNKGVNADFLQVGFDSQHFNPLGKTNPSYPEIIFMGSNYPNSNFPLTKLRFDMVERLRKEFGNRFMVYGGGWESVGQIVSSAPVAYNKYVHGNGFIRPVNNQPRAMESLKHNVIDTYKEEGTAYRSCKIAINLSHFDYVRYSSDRMYRILGCGTFCLSHNYQGIETDFKIGKELDVWNSIDELVEKIKYYLNNDVERERIAMAGCYKAHTNYTWHHFAQNLEKLAKK